MIDTVNRKKMLGLLIKFMAGDIQCDEVYYKGFECLNREDPALMEVFYKILADRNAICDHYITIIKLDWHYYVQMALFLHSDRSLEKFRYFNPSKSMSETISFICLGFILPLALYLWAWLISPYMLLILLLPLVFTVVMLSRYISRSLGRKHNYFPETELPFHWPYDSEEEFKADYLKYETQVDIPLDPPDLTGKVSRFPKENYRWVAPRPDE